MLASAFAKSLNFKKPNLSEICLFHFREKKSHENYSQQNKISDQM